MKSGASDPFADDESGAETETERTTGDDERDDGDAVADTPASESTERSETASSPDGEPALSREELPLVLRRDRVKDERPEVHQLFVQQETHEKAVDAERALESRFEEDLARTDAREAIYLAGMQSLDEAEAILREWGYDL